TLAHGVAGAQLNDGNALVHRCRSRVVAVGNRSKDLHPHGLLQILEPDVGGLFFVPVQNELDLVARVIEVTEKIEQSLAVPDKRQGELQHREDDVGHVQSLDADRLQRTADVQDDEVVL